MTKISDKEQEVAVEILVRFMFATNMKEVSQIWNSIYKSYELHEDPYTGTPCTTKEYLKRYGYSES